MEKYIEPLNDKLNTLLEKIRDSENAFKKASEQTTHVFLKQYFERKSKERYDFENELNNEFILSGLQNENSNTSQNTDKIAGIVSKTWIDLKTLFSFDNNQSILESAINGEKAALEDYNEILNQFSLPLRIRSLLLKQKETIEKDFKTIKKIEDLQ
jgi:uncharacterized protein (TIGR02284 family)